MPNLFRATMGGGSDIEPYIVIVTLNEDFAGQTVTLEQSGQDTLTKVCPTSEPYTVTFKPLHDGVWIAKSTTIDEMESVASTEPLLEWGTYYVELKSGFNFEEWLTQGRVTETFESLDEVLADEKTVRQLMTVHDSVDFLANNVTDEDAAKIFGNDLCAKWINLRDYALDTLYANETCQAAMDDADKYFYGEWALMPQVPKMTSDTAPYGETSVNFDVTGSRTGYKAFNGVNYYGDDATTSTYTTNKNDHTNKYIQYKFPNKKKVNLIKIGYMKVSTEASDTVGFLETNCKIQASNTETDESFVDLVDFVYKKTEIHSAATTAFDYFEVPISPNTEYQYYRVWFENCNFKNATGYAILCPEIQMYAWAPKGNVPIMTSNTAPYGEVSTTFPVNTQPYTMFDGDMTSGMETRMTKVGEVVYKSVNPICLKSMSIKGNSYVPCNPKDFDILGSNDGTNYYPLGTFEYTRLDEPFENFKIEDNNDYYLYHKVYFKNNQDESGASNIFIAFMQFYGRELSVSVPKMTSNTEPYGVIDQSSAYENTRYGYYAFDGTSTPWATFYGGPSSPLNDNKNQWVSVAFGKEVVIEKFMIQNWTDANDSVPKNCIVQWSDDTEIWNDAKSFVNQQIASKVTYVDIPKGEAHKYWRIFIADCYGTTYNLNILALQFYGLDYSERDFDVESPSKYIYDHGVELEELSFVTVGSNVEASKTTNEIYVVCKGGSNTYAEIDTKNPIDLTEYKQIFGVSSGNVYNVLVDGWSGAVGCNPTAPVAFGNFLAITSFTNSKIVYTDIKNVNGNNYIVFSVRNNTNGRHGYVELYLEQ